MGERPEPWLRLALRLARGWDRLNHVLRRNTGLYRRLRIDAYDGVGNRFLLVARGRVLADKVVGAPEAGHSRWRNLRGNLTRFRSREIPYAEVLARYAGREARVKADHEGHFEARLEFPEGLPDRERHPVELLLVSPLAGDLVQARAEVVVPAPGAAFGILSDIDDTLLHTGSLRAWDMAKVVLLRNAHTRLPLPGVSALLRGLHGGSGPRRPLFCVSSSPWNIHDLLASFFALRGFPRPVIFLRDWGIGPEGVLPTSHRSHKLAAIRAVLDTTAPLPYLLLGDSAQEDPEIYREIVEAYPGRVLAAYIRNVDKAPERVEAIRALAEEVLKEGSALVLAQDSLAIAEHAFGKGWLEAADVAAVKEEMDLEGKPSAEAQHLAEAEKVAGPVPAAPALQAPPTVVVENPPPSGPAP